MSNRDKSYLKLAAKIAQASDCVHKHGAVIIRGGSVLAVGINKWKSFSPEVGSTHAEMDALSRLRDAKGATIYVSRINRRGEPLLSKPCKECMESLEDAGIKRVVYTEKGCF